MSTKMGHLTIEGYGPKHTKIGESMREWVRVGAETLPTHLTQKSTWNKFQQVCLPGFVSNLVLNIWNCERFWNRQRLRFDPDVHFSICAVSCAQLLWPHGFCTVVKKRKCASPHLELDCYPNSLHCTWLFRSLVWPSNLTFRSHLVRTWNFSLTQKRLRILTSDLCVLHVKCITTKWLYIHYSLLEFECCRSKYVAPRLGIVLWANSTVVEENPWDVKWRWLHGDDIALPRLTIVIVSLRHTKLIHPRNTLISSR